jgi:ABC-type Zn uptake system ZnuABC Zn-binding protein ZnuA
MKKLFVSVATGLILSLSLFASNGASEVVEPEKTVIYVSNEAMAELVRSQVGSDVVVVVDPSQ